MFRGAGFYYSYSRLSCPCSCWRRMAGVKNSPCAVVGAEAEITRRCTPDFCRKRDRERRTAGKHHILHLPFERVAPGGGGKRQFSYSASNCCLRSRKCSILATPRRSRTRCLISSSKRREIRVIVICEAVRSRSKFSRLRRASCPAIDRDLQRDTAGGISLWR